MCLAAPDNAEAVMEFRAPVGDPHDACGEAEFDGQGAADPWLL